MTFRCPQCATIAAVEQVGEGGSMVRCRACGTRWLARTFDEDPYVRPQFERLAPGDIADATIIEHVSPAFTPRKPRPPMATVVHQPREWRSMKLVGILLGAIVAVVVFRSPILAALAGHLPDAVEQLTFDRVRSETVHLRSGSTLFIEGTIINGSDSEVTLPAIRITLRSPAGDPVSSWLVEPAVAALAAGKSIGFRSALASPPPDATEVTLNLAPREGT